MTEQSYEERMNGRLLDGEEKIVVLLKAVRDMKRYLEAGPIYTWEDREWCISELDKAIAEAERNED